MTSVERLTSTPVTGPGVPQQFQCTTWSSGCPGGTSTGLINSAPEPAYRAEGAELISPTATSSGCRAVQRAAAGQNAAASRRTASRSSSGVRSP